MKLALWIVHWPGQDVAACDYHCNKLVGLGKVLGIKVSWTRCPEGTICTNCENETKKETNERTHRTAVGSSQIRGKA
jgi:hypothetical protein